MTMNHSSQDVDLNVERQVLGALLMEQDAISLVAGRLHPADFEYLGHGHVYEAMLRLEAKNQPISVLTVADALGQHLENVGGINFLYQLAFDPEASVNIAEHAALIRARRQRRDLIKICRDINFIALENPDDLAGKIDEQVDRLLATIHDTDADPMNSLCDELGPAIAAAEEARYGGTDAAGLSTGFYRLDAILGGLKPGNLILLAARPSMGKSALAMNIATAVVGQTEKTVLVLNLEMSARELTYRLIASEGGIETQRLMRGRMKPDEWARATDTCESLYKRAERIRVLDQCHLTPAMVRAHLRNEMRRAKVGLVVVDYIQLMSSGQRRENQNVEVAAISRGLKTLARDFNVPILALSQLNRGIENRSDQLPRLADLRDSGSLEQDADCVIFIHREEHSDTAKIIVSKQRNGPRGTIELGWDAQSVSFRNLQEAHRG